MTHRTYAPTIRPDRLPSSRSAGRQAVGRTHSALLDDAVLLHARDGLLAAEAGEPVHADPTHAH